MRLDPSAVLLNNEFLLNKKLYFISGNESTLIEKVCDSIIKKYQKKGNINKFNIDNINNFVDEGSLFDNKKLFVGRSCKGIDKNNLNKLKKLDYVFIFIQENSSKIKLIKNIFLNDKDSYLIDCYEMNRDSKMKFLNKFLEINNIEISQEVYWFLIEKLDNRYIFFENVLSKLLELDSDKLSLENIKKILTIDDTGKEKLFFSILKKNNQITRLYREKIITNSDVNDLYYYSKFFCMLIIDSKNQDDFIKNIPKYLFREKSFLIDIYKKYNLNKKKLLIKLLTSTESALRKNGDLSVVSGLRFLLSMKRITIS
tara:strand:+ start:9136 stop:10074 length:939 start_codon:yes stop_codon:yes gene_type:complete